MIYNTYIRYERRGALPPQSNDHYSINTLVSSEPGCEMPDWDKQFRKEAYKQGVQLIKKDMVGQWAVYLFVDDTAFLAERTEDMNRILAAYNNFINKWRIRINASKCKTLENEYV